MTRAELEAAAAERYPDTEWSNVAALRWAYVQGRLDQAEADARIAESVYPLGATVLGDAPSRIAQAIRQGVE